MRNIIRKLVYCSALSLFAGCEQGSAALPMSVTTYNYTTSSLYDIHIQEASKKFDINTAGNGGSVFWDNSDTDKLADGRRYAFVADVCCLLMSRDAAKSSLRIVWNEVYDLAEFRRGEREPYDKRATGRAPLGSVWCAAIVNIKGTLQQQSDKLVLHFLQDGQIIAVVGDVQVDRPLSDAEIALHSPKSHGGKLCIHELDNPWYGAPPQETHGVIYEKGYGMAANRLDRR